LQKCEFIRRRAGEMSINKQRQLAPFQIERVFHLELEVGKAFDAGYPLCF